MTYVNELWPYGIGWRADPELKPCPFCGGVAVLATIGNEHTKKRALEVKCSNCRFGRTDKVIRHSLEWLKPIVVAAWNSRTDVPPER